MGVEMVAGGIGPCAECGRRTRCSLCSILAAVKAGDVDARRLTAEQEDALRAFIRSRDMALTGPDYHRMIAAGLPEWGAGAAEEAWTLDRVNSIRNEAGWPPLTVDQWEETL